MALKKNLSSAPPKETDTVRPPLDVVRSFLRFLHPFAPALEHNNNMEHNTRGCGKSVPYCRPPCAGNIFLRRCAHLLRGRGLIRPIAALRHTNDGT
jgi:hypothetical protein